LKTAQTLGFLPGPQVGSPSFSLRTSKPRILTSGGRWPNKNKNAQAKKFVRHAPIRSKGEIEVIHPRYSGRAASLLAVLPLILSAQTARDNIVPLKNWDTPLYWHPNATERAAAAKATPQLQLSTDAVSQDALTFVAITPCRLVDTRGTVQGFDGNVPFSGPPIAAMQTVVFPVLTPNGNTMPAPCNTVPPIAEAYSFNITVIPHGVPVTFVTVWPNGTAQPVISTLDDPLGTVVANAAIVAAGAPNGGIDVYNQGPAAIDLVIDMNGYFAAPTDMNGNTGLGVGTIGPDNTGSDNTAVGLEALGDNTLGVYNTASGSGALTRNTCGNNNTASGSGALFCNTMGSNNTANGYQALHVNLLGANNTASGYQALLENIVSNNTAVGFQALMSNNNGTFNTATGSLALSNNLGTSANTANGYAALRNNIGTGNTASGYQALNSNLSGGFNTAMGNSALAGNTVGANNTASGYNALSGNFGGQNNTADGSGAGSANISGNNNIAVGFGAGSTAPIANNDSIYIGATGADGDSPGTIQIGTEAEEVDGIIRIGTSQMGGTFIAGISGTSVTSGVDVLVNSNGLLGTVLSSGRFKEQITDMGDSSSKLLQLRPVSFFYKPQYDDGSRLPQYGLIAEEVAKVYPEMVAYDNHGEILSVKYHLLAPMLLNELQKQAAENLQQAQDIRSLEDRLAALEAGLASGPLSGSPNQLQGVH
jgi:Chaperone of endosialidase